MHAFLLAWLGGRRFCRGFGAWSPFSVRSVFVCARVNARLFPFEFSFVSFCFFLVLFFFPANLMMLPFILAACLLFNLVLFHSCLSCLFVCPACSRCFPCLFACQFYLLNPNPNPNPKPAIFVAAVAACLLFLLLLLLLL